MGYNYITLNLFILQYTILLNYIILYYVILHLTLILLLIYNLFKGNNGNIIPNLGGLKFPSPPRPV